MQKNCLPFRSLAGKQAGQAPQMVDAQLLPLAARMALTHNPLARFTAGEGFYALNLSKIRNCRPLWTFFEAKPALILTSKSRK